MGWSESALLGLIQGLTEFLPISSSGHLVLSETLLGFGRPEGALVEVMLHLGSALSIVAVFWRDVLQLLGALPRFLRPRDWKGAWSSDPAFRTAVLVLLSSVPAGLVGLLMAASIEPLFAQPRAVGALLLCTGAMLLGTRLLRAGSRPVGLGAALAMGLAQALAILPGISRSGATITVGLMVGSERREVGRFAFLMGLLPMAGAGLLKALEMGSADAPGAGALAAGVVVAFASGVVALLILMRFLSGGRLYLFGPYCLVLGLLATTLT